MFIDEIEQIPECTPEETAALLIKSHDGDQLARERLVQGHLKTLSAIAKEYEDKGVLSADLFQEANLAFLLFLNEFDQSQGTFHDCLDQKVRQAMEAAVAFHSNEMNVEEELAARVNVLKEVSQIMADELGREATVEELAAKMKMTVDEIKDIMKLTLDALSVSPS